MTNEENFYADELLTYDKNTVSYSHENYVIKTIENYINTIFESLYRTESRDQERESLENIFNILDEIYYNGFSKPNEDGNSNKEELCSHLRKYNQEKLTNLASNIDDLDNVINFTDRSKLLIQLRSRLHNECAGIFIEGNKEIDFVKDIAKNTLSRITSEQRARLNFPSPNNSSTSETTEDTLLNETDDYSQTDSRPNSSLTNPRTENPDIKNSKIR